VKAPTRSGYLAYGVAIAILLVDQLSKHWVLGDLRLTDGQTVAVWGPLHLTLVANPGVAYGLLKSGGAWARWALSAFELIVAAALALWAWRAERGLVGLAVGLIMGGAIGNLADRVRRGAVVDFLDFQRLHFPWVFNIADSAITVGIVLLIAESLIPRKAPAT
jgi:signal peptidase II